MGFYFEHEDTNITIVLEPGVHLLGLESGTGKTYLCKKFKQLRSVTKSVLAYTYQDFLANLDFKHAWESIPQQEKDDELEVVLFDRFDMYGEHYIDLVKTIGKDFIVLLDCKNMINKIGDDFCDIEYYLDDDNNCCFEVM